MLAAVKAGDAAQVRALLKQDPALATVRDEDGTSAMLAALYRGKTDVVKVLLGARPPLTIFEAAALGKTARIRDLLSERAGRVRAYSHDGYTPLHLAAFFGRLSAARLLLRCGALVNAPSRNGMRVQPLGSAAAGNHTTICRVLLRAGADVHARQEGGFTALDAAEQNGNRELVQMIRDADQAILRPISSSRRSRVSSSGMRSMTGAKKPSTISRRASGSGTPREDR